MISLYLRKIHFLFHFIHVFKYFVCVFAVYCFYVWFVHFVEGKRVRYCIESRVCVLCFVLFGMAMSRVNVQFKMFVRVGEEYVCFRF